MDQWIYTFFFIITIMEQPHWVADLCCWDWHIIQDKFLISQWENNTQGCSRERNFGSSHLCSWTSFCVLFSYCNFELWTLDYQRTYEQTTDNSILSMQIMLATSCVFFYNLSFWLLSHQNKKFVMFKFHHNTSSLSVAPRIMTASYAQIKKSAVNLRNLPHFFNIQQPQCPSLSPNIFEGLTVGST